MADARTHGPVRPHRHRHQVVPDLRRGARADQRRPQQGERDRSPHALPRGLRLLPDRPRGGDRDAVLPRDARAHPLPDARPRSTRALRMRMAAMRMRALLVNLLLAAGAVIMLLPFAWMLSLSVKHE